MNLEKHAILCRNLSVGYVSGAKQKIVLSGIDAHFGIGQLAAIAGLNGVGKSTLLKTIAGLLKPLNGELFLFGKLITSYSKKQLANIVSVVLTDRPQEQWLNVFETVASGRAPYTGFWGKLSPKDHQIIQQSIEYVGVAQLKTRLMHNLSDGERQKVMIARAIAQDTPIIVLDEPAAFLDFPSKIELMHLLKRLAAEQHKTILFSSHDLDLIIRTADNVWLLGNQMPTRQGVPEILLKNNSFAEFFGNLRLRFDEKLGHFQVHESFKGSYKIDGDVQDKALIGSALQRNGYLPTTEEIADIQVKAGNNTLILIVMGEKYTFENFDALINGIQSL